MSTRCLPLWISLLVILLSGCSDEPEEITQSGLFTDDLGRTVAVPPSPERVLTLSPNLTEIVYAAGAGDRLAGANAADDFPPAVDTLPRFSVLPIDFEAIARLRPDLVLGTDQVNNPEDAKTFASLDIPIVFFSFATVDDIFRAVHETGILLGTEEAARDSADSLASTLAHIRQQTDDISRRPRVLFLIGDDNLYAFGKDSYIHGLIDAAGGKSVTRNLDATSPVLSEEYVLRQKPDVIIGTFGEDYNPERLLSLHPTWSAVPAVQDNRVYSLAGELILRPGPRVVEGTRRMAAALHPDHVAPSPASASSP